MAEYILAKRRTGMWTVAKFDGHKHPDTIYTVSADLQRCNCPHFMHPRRRVRICKHILMVKGEKPCK